MVQPSSQALVFSLTQRCRTCMPILRKDGGRGTFLFLGNNSHWPGVCTRGGNKQPYRSWRLKLGKGRGKKDRGGQGEGAMETHTRCSQLALHDLLLSHRRDPARIRLQVLREERKEKSWGWGKEPLAYNSQNVAPGNSGEFPPDPVPVPFPPHTNDCGCYSRTGNDLGSWEALSFELLLLPLQLPSPIPFCTLLPKGNQG